jgi:hypothetical protein
MVKLFDSYKEICHPDQVAVYCQFATIRQKAEYKVKYGRDILYMPNKSQLVCNHLVFKWKFLVRSPVWQLDGCTQSSSSWAWHITELVNNKNVPNQVALNVAQHRSFGSQKPYARGSVLLRFRHLLHWASTHVRKLLKTFRRKSLGHGACAAFFLGSNLVSFRDHVTTLVSSFCRLFAIHHVSMSAFLLMTRILTTS